VHPSLLAIGSERYEPYRPDRPQELLTIANALLGFNQASLAKYLIIAAGRRPSTSTWGCSGPRIIDARIKAWHAPPLVENGEVSERVDRLASKGGPLHGLS